MQQLDNQFIGAGEVAAFNLLKNLTNLPARSLKEFPKSGIYKQVPLEWIIHKHDYEMLSPAHKKGSIDIFLVLNQIKIAVRIQGSGHGEALKGLGKAKHDKVQADLIKKYCSLVDVYKRECRQLFKDRVTNAAELELIESFKTAGVMIPVA